MNNINTQLAKHLREVFFGGNWTYSNVRDQLKDVNLQQATRRVDSLNTILALTYHIGYYVTAILNVFEGRPLDSKDELSFKHPEIKTEQEWQGLKDNFLKEAERLAIFIEQTNDDKWAQDFTDKKYGIYYRNIHGLIEHTHYHLGQIAVIKKLIMSQNL